MHVGIFSHSILLTYWMWVKLLPRFWNAQVIKRLGWAQNFLKRCYITLFCGYGDVTFWYDVMCLLCVLCCFRLESSKIIHISMTYFIRWTLCCCVLATVVIVFVCSIRLYSVIALTTVNKLSEKKQSGLTWYFLSHKKCRLMRCYCELIKYQFNCTDDQTLT